MKWRVKTKNKKASIMSSKIKKILSKCKFFKLKHLDTFTTVSLEKPSLIILNNIQSQYLQFTHAKTKSIPIYLTKEHQKQKVSYGFIEPNSVPNKIKLKEGDNNYNIVSPTELKLHLVYPKQDVMQHFIKWQRYRKYWWSSITTTPSLFLINDMKQDNNTINVNIAANFPWGQQVVESITLNSASDKNEKSYLVCNLGLETALLTVMLDASSNGTKEGYMRLHNKLAPYKFSFALNLKDDPNHNKTVINLAKLINYKLTLKKISTWLPEFSLQLHDQIKQNLQLGIPYTIFLDDVTLKNGILCLMNSSTMLKEQIHLADLESYAEILCKS